MRIILLISIYSLVALQKSSAQVEANSSYHPPLAIPLVLSANFGELRPHHFHMGVDFKTNGVEGLPMYAIDTGYVARIKISPNGYGKVIYVNHPKGITSVYAHCSAFPTFLDTVIRSVQVKEESTEVDIYFPAEQLPLKKGQHIAYSGNTGHSFGPHLHFELRETATDAALNPLVYGFSIADHKAPEIKRIKAYAVTKEGYMIPGKTMIAHVTKQGTQWMIPNAKLIVPSTYCSPEGGIGLAFEATDRYDGAANVCGLYEGSLRVSESSIFCQRIDRIPFEQTRYINSHKDYQEYTNKKGEFHKSFKTKQNPLGIYPCASDGIIRANPGDSLPVHYQAKDLGGNLSEIRFSLNVSHGQPSYVSNPFPSDQYFLPDSAYHFENEYISFHAEANTFYEPTPKNLNLKGTFRFGDPSFPIEKAIEVRFKLSESAIKRKNYYISVITEKGKKKALLSSIEGNEVVAKSSYLGTFSLKVDSIAPSLRTSNFTTGEVTTKKARLSWAVSDVETGLSEYDCYIDGKWYPIEYEPKANLLILHKKDIIPGKHQVLIKVNDKVGNTNEWNNSVYF
jgi:murein DD-endopeptidase MepM/ murein hydrolase activator NlpD